MSRTFRRLDQPIGSPRLDRFQDRVTGVSLFQNDFSALETQQPLGSFSDP